MSVTTPGVPIAGLGSEARALARTINNDLGNSTSSSSRLGFFGTLPDWRDVNGTLDEIDYLYQSQRLCHGVAIFTSYGDRLLGDSLFAPIWEKLNGYRALVFVHPTQLPGVQPTYMAETLPAPIIDFPLATTRSAVDLVMSGTMKRNQHVDVILSHAGGTLPFLATRAIGSLLIPDVAAKVAVSIVQARRDFARFYLDIALSTSPAQLDGVLRFTDPSKVLFGSDFPYAPQITIDALILQYAGYVASNTDGWRIAPDVLRSNSVELLKRHQLDKALEEENLVPR